MGQAAAPDRKSASINWKGIPIRVSYLQRSAGAQLIVFLHGLKSDSRLFLPFFRVGSLQPYSMIAPDLVGFGESDKPPEFSYDLEDQLVVVRQLIDSIGPKSITVIGHSLGGMLATMLLDKIPTIDKLVSLEGNLIEEDCGESLTISRKSFEEFEKYHLSENTPAHAFHRTCLAIVKWSRSGQLLQSFNTSSKPKLLVIGSDSKFASRPDSKGTVIKTIPKAGHFLLQDQPDLTIKAITDFLG